MKLIKPMLAKAATKIPDFNPHGWYASGKVDGFRATVQVDPITGKPVVYTRSLKPHVNPHIQHLFARDELVGCDGELVVDGDFRNCSSLLRRTSGKPAVTFWVFDFLDDTVFRERRLRLDAIRYDLPNHVQLLPQLLVTSENPSLQTLNEYFVDEGFEGVCFRHPQGRYKEGPGRSNDLVKYKTFKGIVVDVVGVEYLRHNYNTPQRNELGQLKRSSRQAGMEINYEKIGALICRHPDFSETFNVGTQTEENRTEWVDESKRPRSIMIKYQPHGSTTMRPRIPTLVKALA